MKLTVTFRNFANAPKVILHLFVLGLMTFDALFSDYVECVNCVLGRKPEMSRRQTKTFWLYDSVSFLIPAMEFQLKFQVSDCYPGFTAFEEIVFAVKKFALAFECNVSVRRPIQVRLIDSCV